MVKVEGSTTFTTLTIDYVYDHQSTSDLLSSVSIASSEYNCIKAKSPPNDKHLLYQKTRETRRKEPDRRECPGRLIR